MDEQIWGLDPGSAHIVFHEYYRFKPFLNTPKKPKALPCYTPLDMHGYIHVFTNTNYMGQPRRIGNSARRGRSQDLGCGYGYGMCESEKGKRSEVIEMLPSKNHKVVNNF